jgi:ABC-type transporter Mla subunit MlaD
MNYVIAAILGALAMLWAILFGKRGRVLDNGSGADRIRDSLADSKDRASDISRQIVDTSGTVADITEHIGSASDSVDKAIGVVQSIRRRGATSNPVAQTGPDRD